MSGVPCNGCTACCRGWAVLLQPEKGDDLSQFEYEMHLGPVNSPTAGVASPYLKQSASGDCVYLGDGGCSIYGRAPVSCQEFDCRMLVLSKTPQEWTHAVSVGAISPEIVEAGKDRLSRTRRDVWQRKQAKANRRAA
jgi:hypothetical protein